MRILTVDLENDLRSHKCKSIEVIVPKLLDFFDDNKITATFFTVSSLLEKYESEIKAIAKKHEIASHSHTHPWLNSHNAEYEIKTSKEKFSEYGIKCSGFRAPGAITTQNHFSLLKKYGYQYDSSLAHFFPGRYHHPNLPKKPFVNQGILEFPVPSFLPAINSSLSYLKLLHPLSKLFQRQYLFYLHPWEFLKKEDLPSGSLIKNLLKRNSGPTAWKIFQEHIGGSKWTSCQEWLKTSQLQNNNK
ncbi:polysaccharide deacetylase family protein [Candidatus Woesearchaeota archaeon]|nr:polysaccharide deacetylase family protein [Candidatus Woesearchaeota archaeon]